MELVATPGNPVPSQPTVMRVVAADGVGLRVARWRPTGKPSKGTVCIVQGRAEFIEKYFETVRDLRRRGFAVVAFDWRGQGGSERELKNGRKGHIDDFSLYQRDLDAVIRHVLQPHCPRPHFALAHSMGAALLLQRSREGHGHFARLVALAPMIALSMVKRNTAARLAAMLLDGLGFGAAFIPGGGETSIATKPFAGNRLSNDPVRYARNAAVVAAAPELAIGDPTIAWINAAYRFMRGFQEPRFALNVTTPTLVVAAGADPVVATPAVERFAARLKAGHALVIPHAKHEILMERDVVREAFWAAFDAFVPGSPVFDGVSAVEESQRRLVDASVAGGDD
ncbi:alpha/beta hydrolase [Chelatococcus sp. SYSU_G07232]|uniref:Alpha/beta hydrolase n=1 Tax=Chelatococcus albus TaxID=3047466 RepID=A0ABT7AG24_9HYPH|nr:alpha/beta hydrolase [Chelatococcus sp. SYSU_G07232]MDJ1158308.1 alpha/beta hydrolase [Chelatococcus sp. SYSU_G07232]